MSDIHAAFGIVPAAGREAVEPALVNRCASCRRMGRMVRATVHREVRRAGAVPDQHRAGDQQKPKSFIHGTGPVSWSRQRLIDHSTDSVDGTKFRTARYCAWGEMGVRRGEGVRDIWGWSIESLSTKLIPRRKGRCIV
jgi:hypothetical protein